MTSYVLITVVPEKVCITTDPFTKARRNVQERKAFHKVTKTCFVPMCTNTSVNSKKLFLVVPRDKQRRQRWMKAVKKPISMSMLYCCEDHFNLEEDASNWMFYKTVGKNLQMKKDVVPHKNINQEFTTDPHTSQISSDDKNRKEIMLENLKKKSFDDSSDDETTTGNNNTHNFEFVELPNTHPLNNIKLVNIENIKTESYENSFQLTREIKNEIIIEEETSNASNSVLKSILEYNTSVESTEHPKGCVSNVKVELIDSYSVQNEYLDEIDSMEHYNECVPNAYLELEYNLDEGQSENCKV